VSGFIDQNIARSPANTDNLAWTTIQQKVLKKKRHVRDDRGLNVIRYQVKGQGKSTAINAVLFQDRSLVFGDRNPPASNPHLIKCCQTSKDN